MRFELTRLESDAKRYRLEGNDGFESAVLELPNLEDAKHFAENYRSDQPMPLLLIPNDNLFDVHGFWLHSTFHRSNGRHFLSKDRLLVGCDSIR